MDKTLNSTPEVNQQEKLKTVRRWKEWGGLDLSNKKAHYKAITWPLASTWQIIFFGKTFLNTCY